MENEMKKFLRSDAKTVTESISVPIEEFGGQDFDLLDLVIDRDLNQYVVSWFDGQTVWLDLLPKSDRITSPYLVTNSFVPLEHCIRSSGSPDGDRGVS